MKKYAFTLALLIVLSGCAAPQDKQESSTTSAALSSASSMIADVSGEASQQDSQAARAALRSNIINASANISKMDQIVTDALTHLTQTIQLKQAAIQDAAMQAEQAGLTSPAEQPSIQTEQQTAQQETPAQQAPPVQESSSSEGSQFVPTQPTDVLEEPVQKPKATVSGTNFLSKVEDQVLALINEERANQGLSPLASDPDLKTAARIRSKELCKSGTFAHQRPNGDEWSTVITQDVPIKFIAAGENLCTTTYNDPNLDSAYDAQFWFDRWYNSPGHYENMVRPNFTHVGVGIYCVKKDGFVYAYATTIFAEL